MKFPSVSIASIALIICATTCLNALECPGSWELQFKQIQQSHREENYTIQGVTRGEVEEIISNRDGYPTYVVMKVCK